MNNETPAVEIKKDESAATQPESVVTPTTTEVDYEAILAEKDAELAKIKVEKENYRKGMLIAKGKLPEENYLDNDSTETQEDMVRRVTREELLATKEAQLLAEKEAAIKAQSKRIKELEVALKNRGQISISSGTGSNQEKPEGKKDNYFSNEQINALKARGYDDKKIELLKKNMTKVNQMPQPQ